MGKSERSFIHLVSQSVCQCMRVCYIPAGPGGATDWVIPPSDFGGGPQDHSSGSAYACNYLRFARHPMLGLWGLSQQVQASPGRSEGTNLHLQPHGGPHECPKPPIGPHVPSLPWGLDQVMKPGAPTAVFLT